MAEGWGAFWTPSQLPTRFPRALDPSFWPFSCQRMGVPRGKGHFFSCPVSWQVFRTLPSSLLGLSKAVAHLLAHLPCSTSPPSAWLI